MQHVFLFTLIFDLYVCMSGTVQVSMQVREQLVGTGLSLTTTWVPGTQLESSDLTAASVTHWPVSPAHVFFSFLKVYYYYDFGFPREGFTV